MAYFNWPNTSLYSTSTSGGYDVCPSQVFVPEHMDVCAPETSANGWGVHSQQYYDDVDRWPTSLEPEANLEPTTSGTSYDQWLYTGLHWPTIEQYTQPDYGILNYDNIFASAATLGAPELIPAPSNSEPSLLLGGFEEPSTHQPRTDWGGSESEQITDTLYADPQTPHQPGVRTMRTRSMTRAMKKYRRQPYSPPCTRTNERTNAEAGPSNLTALPPANPSGGTSETSADAENINTDTEENAAPIKRRPGTGRPRPGRGRYQEQIRRLRDWARRRKNLPKSPTHERALTIALEALYQVSASDRPSLRKSGGGQKGKGKRDLFAERERTRRKGIRELYAELGSFYGPPEDGLKWKCPKLLSRVLQDIGSLPKPPATSSA